MDNLILGKMKIEKLLVKVRTSQFLQEVILNILRNILRKKIEDCFVMKVVLI
jgi:hypothetical protein